MREHEALISEYVHLKAFPREGEALEKLRKVASVVKPIMRTHGFRVKVLAEFYPNETLLLGWNQNRTEICLRLRYPGDRTQFLPLEDIIHTMLHELAHMLHWEHDARFDGFLDQLSREYLDLRATGYTGEGFLSMGHKLGGSRVPPPEERRRRERARVAKIRPTASDSGQRLGTGRISAFLSEAELRRRRLVALDREATLGREVRRGCESGVRATEATKEAAERAIRNGFRTSAAEDEANDLAIAQALWELDQEEDNAVMAGEPLETRVSERMLSGNLPSTSASAPQRDLPTRPTRPVSRLVLEAENKKRQNRGQVSGVDRPSPPIQSSEILSPQIQPSPHRPPRAMDPSDPIDWACPSCTLTNSLTQDYCRVCDTERPLSVDIDIMEAATSN